MTIGIVSLGDFTLGANGTQTGEWVTGLKGLTAATLQARLAVGAGGGTAKVYIQTSLDGGVTAVDVACMTFTTASAAKVQNVSGLTAKSSPATPADAALTDDTTLDGVLGDRLRAKVVTAGTVYTGSTVLSVRAATRK
jgi:hypothetical protein